MARRVYGRTPSDILKQISPPNARATAYEVLLTGVDADSHCEELLQAMAKMGLWHVGVLGASGDRGLFDGLSLLFASGYLVRLASTDEEVIQLLRDSWLERRLFGIQKYGGPEARWEFLTPYPECREGAGSLPRAVAWSDSDLSATFWKKDGREVESIEVLTNIHLLDRLEALMFQNGYISLQDYLPLAGAPQLGAFVATFGRGRLEIAHDIHKQEALDIAASIWVKGNYVAMDFTILSFNLYALP